MSESEVKVLQPRKPIAIIRLDNLEDSIHMSRALLEGGVTEVEFTLTNTKALATITEVRGEFANNLVVGVGTVLDAEHAHAAIDAGAQFLVTPALLPDVIKVANKRKIPIVCGAYTPTEILTAWRMGADLIKVFPAGRLGPGYIKDVLAPLPQLRLVPTGGVNLDTCAAFLAAGAYTVAVGSQLVSKELVRKKDWSALAQLAQCYVEACK